MTTTVALLLTLLVYKCKTDVVVESVEMKACLISQVSIC